MQFDPWWAFASFAAATSITPGPNNTMMLSSGLRHGLVRSLPHLAGISVGFVLMVFATGLGLHAVFVQFPWLQTLMKFAGAAYLLWLAWQLAHSAPPGAHAPTGAPPMGFVAAALFQWVNPKAWVMAVSAVTTYLPASFRPVDALLLALFFGAVNLPCVGAWAAFGVGMRKILQSPRSVRLFNRVTAGMLVASLYPILTL